MFYFFLQEIAIEENESDDDFSEPYQPPSEGKILG